jgi:hypothetical protein
MNEQRQGVKVKTCMGKQREMRTSRGVAEKIFGAPLPWGGDDLWIGCVPLTEKRSWRIQTHKRSDSNSPWRPHEVNTLGEVRTAGGRGAEKSRRWHGSSSSVKGDFILR